MRFIVVVAVIFAFSSCDSSPVTLHSPNETPETAIALELGESVDARIFRAQPRGGSGYLFYTFAIGMPAVVGINVTNFESQNFEFRIESMTRWWADRFASSITKEDGLIKHRILLEAGEYLVLVGNPDCLESDVFFSLELSADTSDAFEINNTLESAKSVLFGQELEASLDPIGDVDIFSFNKVDNSPLDLFTNFTSSLDFEILSENGNLIQEGSLGTEGSVGIQINNLSGGNYFLKFKKSPQETETTSNYSFTLHSSLHRSL